MTKTTKLTEQQRKQNTFNVVWAHSLNMEERSYDYDKEMCMYRGPHDNRCFIGALFPDELYSSEMEEKNSDVLLSDFNLDLYFMENGLTIEEGFLRGLQRIHDGMFEQHAKQLEAFALDNRLTVPE